MTIDVRAIQTLLMTNVIGSQIIWHERIGSTSDAIRTMLATDPPEGLVICANDQSAGHGRFQREWVSEAGANLTFSILLRPPFPDDQVALINFAASLAIVNTFDAYPGILASVRWPNDVCVNGRKICGILAERTGDVVILGIGINVNQLDFPDALVNATSLARETGGVLDRGRIFHIALAELDEQYARARQEGFEGIMREWRLRCDLVGAQITLKHGADEVQGILAGVDNDGALVLRDSSGDTQRYYAGETTHHLHE